MSNPNSQVVPDQQLLRAIAGVLAGISKDDFTTAERQIASKLVNAGILLPDGRTDGETYRVANG